MALLKFFLDSLRPISKTADIWDIKDIIQAILIFGGWGGGGWFTLTAHPNIAVWVLSGIPALLFLIAGIKLQSRLTSIDNIYRYALSPGDFDAEWIDKRITLWIKLSNAIDRPIKYQILKNKTYIEITNMPRIELQSSDSGLITAKDTILGCLPGITTPDNYPCTGILHYEIVYGSPSEFLFKQIRDYVLDIYLTTNNLKKEINIKGHYDFHEDEPIKQPMFHKAGYRT